MEPSVGGGRTASPRSAVAAVLAATAALLAGACASPDRDVPGSTPTTGPAVPTPEVTVTDPSPSPSSPIGSARAPGAPGGSTEAAVQDLAERLGVPPAEVTVVRAVEVTWRDRSLGCPQPGMSYAQVLTDGTLIELEASGQTYEYHAGERRGPFLCERPEPPLEVHG